MKVLNYWASKKNALKKVKQIVVVLAIVLAYSAGFASCKDNDADGREASTEFCDCYEKNSKDYCFEELKKKWNNYENSDFIEAFNEASTCNARLYREKVSGVTGIK
ncbi:MAG: hypothetical protein LBE04_07410 [Prevotellaceae bacterium]|jgi:hypothetical protein|nr:hypothetical protein [Prevotellaceae bacterium]